MSLSPISSNIINLLNEEPVTFGSSTSSPEVSFSDIFTQAFETVAETDHADKASALELLSGQSDDMSGLLLDAEKAEISLNLALQIRNKVMDAYSEIMRMQV